MDEQKQISYGILGGCIGIVVGFAIGFPIFFHLSWGQRSYIGLPFMLILVLATCIYGAVLGVKIAKKGEIEDEE